MTDDANSPLARYGSLAVQFAIAAPLLFPPLVGREVGTLFAYYGAVVVLLPAGIRLASGTTLSPVQRALLSGGIGLHGWGLLFRIYPQVWWWDVLTHAVSAAFLAAGLYALVRATVGPRPAALGWRLHVVVLSTLLVAGVGWEVYEVVAPWQTVYPTGDAAKDLAMNTVGWGLMARIHPALLGDVPDHLARRIDRLGPWTDSTPGS